jgi:hypothetical protein
MVSEIKNISQKLKFNIDNNVKEENLNNSLKTNIYEIGQKVSTNINTSKKKKTVLSFDNLFYHNFRQKAIAFCKSFVFGSPRPRTASKKNKMLDILPKICYTIRISLWAREILTKRRKSYGLEFFTC